MKKAYLSCARLIGPYGSRYHLHTAPPDWRTSESETGGGLWSSAGMVPLCKSAVERVLGDRTPAVGELLELPVRPGKTWIWK